MDLSNVVAVVEGDTVILEGPAFRRGRLLEVALAVSGQPVIMGNIFPPFHSTPILSTPILSISYPLYPLIMCKSMRRGGQKQSLLSH